MGIDTHQEPTAYMREDCHVCRAEGFDASSRIQLSSGRLDALATLNVVAANILPEGHIGLSRIALSRLRVSHGDAVFVAHAPVLPSLRGVRKKIHGHALSDADIRAIVSDINDHRYSDLEIGSFLSVCAAGRLNLDEIISLTHAMVDCGKRLDWHHSQRMYDKHCIGGLPGNRTTPIVVAIVSAAGLVIPKTSSRAITSPAGTADTLETLTNVHLSLQEMQRVVDQTGACLAWGGAVNLSPADDVLIRIERALELDGEGQLIASVLSKKIAAGSTDVVIDIPVGPTAKIRSDIDAARLSDHFLRVGEACGIHVRCVITDGCCPVGFGIGPVEEARDILAVLQCVATAPADLRARSLTLAAHLLDMADAGGMENSLVKARAILDDGKAWTQFQRILQAQGGIKTLPEARFKSAICAHRDGRVVAIDNRRLARLAKLAGAPTDPAAGLRIHTNCGSTVRTGDPLFTLLTESSGERDYALSYYESNRDMFSIGE